MQMLGLRTLGFGESRAEVVINVLIISTGAWRLWWKVPGSRPA
ncbi:hypothetical protein [Streptomyces rubellomurinus]|nr:hypothetical protein [Streptomyces rubellomurinus]